MKQNRFLYLQIKNKIQEYIKENKLQPNDLIPSEIKFSEFFNVSRVTVRSAIDKLVEEDILYKKKGSGTYIKKLDHSKLISLTEESTVDDKVLTNKVLEFKICYPTKEIAEILKIDEKESIYFISRLRMIDDKPVVIEYSYMPLNLFTDLSLDILTKSKYDYIENQKKYIIEKSSQTILPLIATEELSRFLGIEKNTPILQVNSIGTLEDDIIFEYTIHYYNPFEYTYIIEAKR